MRTPGFDQHGLMAHAVGIDVGTTNVKAILVNSDGDVISSAVRSANNPLNPLADRTIGDLKRWFWRPPRPHGETIADRAVTFLELFYDLVYVTVIAQTAHHLAEHLSIGGFAEFAVIFAVVWVAWINGTLYLELHGHDDGRSRIIVFAQMGILALLAVYAGDAAGAGGRAFGIVYAVFLVVLTVLWYTVWRADRPEFRATTGQYVVGMVVSVVVISIGAFLPAGPRLIVWALFALAWMGGIVLIGRRSPIGLHQGIEPTHSLVERFGLLVIIVLGEVVFGVVSGLSTSERDFLTVATGMMGLLMALGLWWIYFDLVGRRLPRNEGGALSTWMLSHLPITLAIAAAGAGMVSLIGHAHEDGTPIGSAWLLAGAAAVGLLAMVPVERSLVDAERLPAVYRPLNVALISGAALALMVGWLHPTPWLLVLLLVLILSGIWFLAATRFLRTEDWGDASR